jgi:hypothetical protein
MIDMPACHTKRIFGVGLFILTLPACGADFDAVPFGLALTKEEGVGVKWEDPREIHKVVVHFASSAPASEKVRLEYWGSRWPEQHLPKDRQPGGADVGWMELGNWYTGDWRAADTQARTEADALVFEFRPVNTKEFPALKDYSARFRYTFKIRVNSDSPLPKVSRIEAFTDSVFQQRMARLEWATPAANDVKVNAFNGVVRNLKSTSVRGLLIELEAASNPDPNTFDRTLVTVRRGKDVFTFGVDDLKEGALFLPHLGVAVLPDSDRRDYAAVAADQRACGAKTLYDRIAEMPEQTWRRAWAGLPRKKSDIYFPLGLDGGRQRFLLEPDGTVRFRCNDRFLQARPGKDTPRLALEAAPARFRFGPPRRPAFRTIEEFSEASERSPVVRLRDGTAIPQIPSYVHRRGRSFGWICQTLEGAMHLLITRAIDPRSAQAEWILKDYEDNLYLSNQYGYTVADFDKQWFDRGGMSMQACLLLDVEPYLYRDDVKHALRALFNAEAVSYFPDVRVNTEHAAPYFDDWRGDHYKSSE